MCNVTQDVKTAIVKSVNDNVEQRKPFSAYDITLQVRQQFAGQRIDPHDEMKQVVHQMFADGELSDYQKTLVQYAGKPIPAFFYYPPEIDPQAVAAATGGQVDSVVARVPQAVTDAVASGSDGSGLDDGAANAPTAPIKNADGSVTKASGTEVLYVPKSMAAGVGIQPKGPAYIAINNGTISITNDSSDPNATKVHVDRNQNIRVPNTALLKIGADGKVQIKVNGKEISISKATN